MANNQAFKIKNGLSAKRYLQNSTAVSASDVDLSTGSYFTKTLSANTTFTFSNPPASGKAMGFALEVTGADVTQGFDLSNAAYDSVNFSLTPIGGVALNNDGTKMFVVHQGDAIYEYSLSTAYDVSTASFVTSFSTTATSNEANPPRDVAFSNDGTTMFVVGRVNGTDWSIVQYDLTTGFDLSTASYNGDNLSVSAYESAVRGVAFNNDGSKMYIVGNSSDKVHQYSLSTNFDVTTASYDNATFSVATQEIDPTSVTFSSDGYKMFVAGYAGDDVNEYSLSTAFDITTATFTTNFSVSSQTTQPLGIEFSNDGGKMFVCGSGAVSQYTTGVSTSATTTWPSSVKWSGATAPDAPASGEKDVYIFVTTDGGTTYYGKQAGDAVA